MCRRNDHGKKSTFRGKKRPSGHVVVWSSGPVLFLSCGYLVRFCSPLVLEHTHRTQMNIYGLKKKYEYTWNPNVPCFDWKRPSFGSKTKDKWVPGINIKIKNIQKKYENIENKDIQI